MICRECRDWCKKGAAHCQRCKRHCSAVGEWDKKMKVVKNIGLFLVLLVIAFLLVLLGKIANRGMDKLLDGWF
jgi:hypothetical protein